MSLARYLSKLGAMLGSDGKVPAVALAANAVQVGMKNRIINGAMMVNQYGAGPFTLNNSNNVYPVDRFASFATVGTVTGQQSTTAPSGFKNSIVFTVSATGSLGATDSVRTAQYIEGLNVADLGWGTASAATVTLSFWVRSSLTGTFGGALRNSANDRCYVFSYTINSANTWEQKTITIAGDTSGTWLTDNGVGIRIFWSLGSGSSYKGAAGSWGGTLLYSVTGETALVTNASANFYITGVQLEKGSTATSFDYRPYGTELALCKRYYEVLDAYYSFVFQVPNASYLNKLIGTWQYEVEKRAHPTLGVIAGASMTGALDRYGVGNITPNSFSFDGGSASRTKIQAHLAANYSTGEVFALSNTASKWFYANSEL